MWFSKICNYTYIPGKYYFIDNQPPAQCDSEVPQLREKRASVTTVLSAVANKKLNPHKAN
jgi:hypothetical protein